MAGERSKGKGKQKRRRAGWSVLALDIPPELRARLDLVSFLDGRSRSEWVRALLSREADRALACLPGWFWMRPGSPVWTEGGAGREDGPVLEAMGGERVWVLARLEAVPVAWVGKADPWEGMAYLCDLSPADGGPGPVARRMVVRCRDVLPSRPVGAGYGPGGIRVLPEDHGEHPAELRADENARRQRARERSKRVRRTGVKPRPETR